MNTNNDFFPMDRTAEFIPVLSLSAETARAHFLCSEYYTDLEIPSYFSFEPLLTALSARMGSEKLEAFHRKGVTPARISETNLTVYTSRDGHGKYRANQLIHPVVYASFVNAITKPATWHALVSRSHSFHCDSRMSVASRPCISAKDRSHRATRVLQWYDHFEQQSIGLSMKYKVLMYTDIKNCYPSMRPELFEKLLDLRCTPSDPETLGTTVSRFIKLMVGGRTGGLPIGCPLVHILSDLIFSYVDWLFFNALGKVEKKGKIDFRVIRYQDDYRFFCHDESTAKRLSTLLSQTLSQVGLELSKEKTSVTRDVLGNSVKADKLYWISIPRSTSLKEELLRIRELGLRFQNSGSVVKALSRCLKEFDQLHFGRDAVSHLAILAEIMHHNPRTYSVGCALVEKIAVKIPDRKQRDHALYDFCTKVISSPCKDLLVVWLQCVLDGLGMEVTYEFPLCKYVSGKLDTLWSTAWLKPEIASLMKNTSVIDPEKKLRLSRSIPMSEVCLFERAS